MPPRSGSFPPSHLHLTHAPPAEPPRSITARGLMYGLASWAALTNATVSAAMAIAAAVQGQSLAPAHLQAVAARLPLWAAAVALVCFHSPAALTLLAPTLGMVQALDFIFGVRRGEPLQLGVALLFAVGTLAVSIPLVAEQALKRRRWLRAIQARGAQLRP